MSVPRNRTSLEQVATKSFNFLYNRQNSVTLAGAKTIFVPIMRLIELRYNVGQVLTRLVFLATDKAAQLLFNYTDLNELCKVL